ncbi:Lrp/AsnC family transcriptional regulator [Thiospirochaeta perfilievii]|uniref:Lrp/AsnC family transcriptional regulator n=1 Tax=Thiospirochaeta perfilievii TaxID=252967 RepID=A0A5C1Q7T9_9SPIO|nr:Lrp/AsnC family transcriptional regulator [Thiospirochaeta perfilievii]QEN03511.1 Lrp/AsnC family transcriptional regulator [Thiospirochaeta perfilievii]
MDIDDTSFKILQNLKDGRESFQKIADNLNLSEGTVRNRVNSLIESGVLEIRGQVDLEALPGYSMVQIGIKLSTMDLVGKGEEISNLPSVLNVLVVTGRFDLMATVLLSDSYSLADFYLKEMNLISDILGVETFVVYKEFNTKIPCSALQEIK